MNKRTRSNNKGKKNPSSGINVPRTSSLSRELKPPPFKEEPIYVRKLRFKTTGAVTDTDISIIALANAFGMMAATTTGAYALYSKVQIINVSMWAWSTGTLAEIRLDWNGPTSGSPASPGNSIYDSTLGTATPAYISSSPPEWSFSKVWNDAQSTTTAFTISAPSGSIIDISLALVLGDGDPAQASVVVAGAVVGTIYHKALSTNITVVAGLNTIS